MPIVARRSRQGEYDLMYEIPVDYTTPSHVLLNACAVVSADRALNVIFPCIPTTIDAY